MGKKFDAVPKSVQDDIDKKVAEVSSISNTHNIEVIGYWVWIGNTVKSDKDKYYAAGFKWSSNKEKMYWAHPQSPKRKYRGRGRGATNKKSKPMPQNQVRDRYKHTNTSADSTIPIAKPLSERDKLEQDLEGVRKTMQVDSGENWINLKTMETDILEKIKSLDSEDKPPLQEVVDAIQQEELEEARAESLEQQAQEQEEAQEEKPDARASLRNLFRN